MGNRAFNQSVSLDDKGPVVLVKQLLCESLRKAKLNLQLGDEFRGVLLGLRLQEFVGWHYRRPDMILPLQRARQMMTALTRRGWPPRRLAAPSRRRKACD